MYMRFFNENIGNFDFSNCRYLKIKTRKLVLGIYVKFWKGDEVGGGHIVTYKSLSKEEHFFFIYAI